MEFENDRLPEGWVKTKISNICNTKSGGTPLRKNPEYFGGKIPWLKSGDLNDSIIHSCEETISEQGLEKSNATIYPKNTVLLAMYGATIGKLSVLGFPASTNQAICAFSHNNKILTSWYLFWFLKSIRRNLFDISFGGAQKNISQEKIKQIPILLPPLNEQKRIVAKIESIFAQIDAGREKLRNVKKLVKQARQSVLKQAFENKKWNYVRFGDFLTLEYGESLSKKNRKNGNIPVFGSAGIGGHHNNALVLYPSLVIGRKGNAGNVMIVKQPFWAIDTTYFLKETKDYNLKFLYNLFKYMNFKKLDSSTAIPSLRRDDVYAQNIPLPPLSEQKRIVSKIESIFSKIDAIEKYVDSTLKMLDALKSSILKQAFEGKLVPQDPDDEPAEILLKKIRQKKEEILQKPSKEK